MNSYLLNNYWYTYYYYTAKNYWILWLNLWFTFYLPIYTTNILNNELARCFMIVANIDPSFTAKLFNLMLFYVFIVYDL